MTPCSLVRQYRFVGKNQIILPSCKIRINSLLKDNNILNKISTNITKVKRIQYEVSNLFQPTDISINFHVFRLR